ncbi:hypothetical protein Forpe1208_v004022 [Fusarium oxysporum f. sp. rapae]|uniref:Uncharacterized protein n=1 Tax=Fusarium oxysporum f. sp. rapae TaxID=485398 RepID=A0A8J5U181_FUSOX|nr:hypothetical protein Forpe1208_v004022 [Fusarium oxysporum f. sp. rapae]
MPMTIGTYNNKEERSIGWYRQEQNQTKNDNPADTTRTGVSAACRTVQLDAVARQDMGGAVIGPSTQWEPEKRRGASTARTPSNARKRAPAKVPSPKFPRKATQYVV